MKDEYGTRTLLKDVMRNRKGQGELKRICICGQIFPLKEDGTNTWTLCGSCRRDSQ